jgi:hypothetical protein
MAAIAAAASWVAGFASVVSVGTTAFAADSSTTATAPSSGSIQLGASVTDGATVTGDDAFGSPTGVVDFFVCGPTTGAQDCTSQAVQVGGDAGLTPGPNDTATATSDAFTPTSTGIWCFGGDYSGDGNYGASSDTSTDECVDVTPAPTATTTVPTTGTLALGGAVSDGATVDGNAAGGSPTGSVAFYACGPTATPEDCTSTSDPVGSAVSVSAGANDTATASSSSFTPTSTGVWCFAGVYSGDGNYQSSSDDSTDECVTVTPGASSTLASPVNTFLVLGQNQFGQATVTGNAAGGSPTGTVSFYQCGASATLQACTSQANPIGGPVQLSPTSGNRSTALSAEFAPNSVGYWCLGAVYSGSGDYQGSSYTSDNCFYVNGPVKVMTTSIPNGTVRQSYNASLQAAGGTQPYKWKRSLGTLPKGLKVDHTAGTLTGIPSVAGTYSFTIEVTDSSHPKEHASQAFTITISS